MRKKENQEGKNSYEISNEIDAIFERDKQEESGMKINR